MVLEGVGLLPRSVASITSLKAALVMCRASNNCEVPMLSKVSDCILEMCTPRSRCMPEHSMQMIMPKLVDSQVASVAKNHQWANRMQIPLTVLRVAVTASIVARQLLHISDDSLLQLEQARVDFAAGAAAVVERLHQCALLAIHQHRHPRSLVNFVFRLEVIRSIVWRHYFIFTQIVLLKAWLFSFGDKLGNLSNLGFRCLIVTRDGLHDIRSKHLLSSGTSLIWQVSRFILVGALLSSPWHMSRNPSCTWHRRFCHTFLTLPSDFFNRWPTLDRPCCLSPCSWCNEYPVQPEAELLEYWKIETFG